MALTTITEQQDDARSRMIRAIAALQFVAYELPGLRPDLTRDDVLARLREILERYGFGEEEDGAG